MSIRGLLACYCVYKYKVIEAFHSNIYKAIKAPVALIVRADQ